MQLCVALDLPSREENVSLAESLKSFDIWLKVGFRTFIRDGRPFLEELKTINPSFRLFLDLKLYDIPNTMADAAEEIAKMEIDMFNIHASAGKKAMQTVMRRLETFKKRPLVLAVTALTSFDYHSFKEIYGSDIEEKVKQFALQSYQAGLDGVVCSVYESRMIKHETDRKFLTLTPGIRPFGEGSDDQKRVADIDKAKEELVDIIVVGRPVYQADNPAETVEKILEKLS
ncbi:orotidine-5'-phosphate decarboxylase [Hydrogenimonas urashimensis]|uniref:orotidine-5'-phosphate decarboxylase n=1 Tax=Hydrogenimonas urashimensis TaxID=2740515 RepID=UPI0019152C21|nr:orotidine-5'-phosphate decarboxylase [Hydrogenimonas urashimensis]